MRSSKKEHDKAKSSFTAITVAQATLSCAKTKKWSHLVEPRTAVILKHFIKVAMHEHPFGKGSLSLQTMNMFSISMRKFVYDKLGCLAYMQHMALRKLFIEYQVRAAIQRGVKQILVIGGGYDTLTLRLHNEFPDVHFIEVDRGLTRDIKQKAIISLGHILPEFKELGANLHFFECDLSKHDWFKFLKAESFFNRNADSIVILEGVTPYLTQMEVNNMFATIREEIITDGSEVIVGFASPNTGISAKVANTLVKESNENFLFNIQAPKVPEYCAQLGFQVTERMLALDLQRLSGNEEVVTYKDHPEYFANEHYFIMKRISGWLENDKATHVKPNELSDIYVACMNIPEPYLNKNKPN